MSHAAALDSADLLLTASTLDRNVLKIWISPSPIPMVAGFTFGGVPRRRREVACDEDPVPHRVRV